MLSFKDLQSVQESKGFKGFKGFLSYLHVLSYYKDFRLLLCSSCNIAVSPVNFKGHLAKHFLDLKGYKHPIGARSVSPFLKSKADYLLLYNTYLLSFSRAGYFKGPVQVFLLSTYC
jgi:hypothetical protein